MSAIDPMGRTKSATTTRWLRSWSAMFIARFAQRDEVPVPPLALKKAISRPPSFCRRLGEAHDFGKSLAQGGKQRG